MIKIFDSPHFDILRPEASLGRVGLSSRHSRFEYVIQKAFLPLEHIIYEDFMEGFWKCFASTQLVSLSYALWKFKFCVPTAYKETFITEQRRNEAGTP